MKKILGVVFVFFMAFSFAKEEVIQAGIKYNETSARIEAFKDIERKVNKDIFEDYLKDKNKKENLENIKNSIFDIKNERYLCPFYVKTTLASYSVTYYNEMEEYTFYYNVLGSLIKFDKIINSQYPIKTYSYSRYGNLISVSFSVDEDEQFIYSENGKLLAHWLGDKMIEKPAILKLIDLRRGENKD